MAFLNQKPHYYYGNNNRVEVDGNALFLIRGFADKDYWFIDFFTGHSLLQAIQDIPNDILERLRAGTASLYLYNSHEAFHDVVEPIYQHFVIGLSIPPSQIILGSESAIIDKEIREVAERYNQEMIHAEWVRIFEYNVSMQKRVKATFPCNTNLENRHYEKKFLNLNRRWRHHRPLLVALLELYGLREQGFVSLADHTDGGGNWVNVLAGAEQLLQGQRHVIEALERNREKILNIPPLYLDTEDLHINRATLTSDTDYYYENSYFSVVTETTFFKGFGDGVFVSEKIFKPIFKRHPFIVVSRPGTLAALRRAGYQTFHPYINEEYDTEENDAKRMIMIVDEIKRLCNLGELDLDYFLGKVEPICEQNSLIIQQKVFNNRFITTLC